MNGIEYHGHNMDELLLLLNESTEKEISLESIKSHPVGGWSNINLHGFTSSYQVIIKLPVLQNFFETNPYEDEYIHSLALYRENLSPDPIEYGVLKDRFGTPFFIRKYVEGRIYKRVDSIPKQSLRTLKNSLNRFSNVTIEDLAEFPRASDYLLHLFDQFEKSIENIGTIPTHLRGYISRYQKAILEFLGELGDYPKWNRLVMHSDLHEGNIVFIESNVQLLDVGDICRGNPLYDLAYMYSQGDGPIADYSTFPGLDEIQQKELEKLIPLALLSLITWTLTRLVDIHCGIVIKPLMTPEIVKSLESYLLMKFQQFDTRTKIVHC